MQTTPEEPPKVQDPVAALLIPRHYAHIKAINERDWKTLAGFQWHVSPDFNADIMYSESIKSWSDYIDAFRSMTDTTAPEFQISVLDVNVTVREHLNKAEVYLLATEEGRTPGLVSHGMSKLEWKRIIVDDRTEWFLYCHTMFRGVTDPVG